MKDWNVVISVYQDGFRRTLRALKEFGPVERSPYYNVLVMKADNPTALLETIEQRTEENTALYDAISRVAPATRTVEFHSVEEFTERLKAILLEWLPRLTGSSLHVRLHRRGDRHDLRTLDAERSFSRLPPGCNGGGRYAVQNFLHGSGRGHCDRHGRRSRRGWTVVT